MKKTLLISFLILLVIFSVFIVKEKIKLGLDTSYQSGAISEINECIGKLRILDEGFILINKSKFALLSDEQKKFIINLK